MSDASDADKRRKSYTYTNGSQRLQVCNKKKIESARLVERQAIEGAPVFSDTAVQIK